MSVLGPGELAARLADLPLAVEAWEIRIGEIPVRGYYGGRPRPTGEVRLTGRGRTGRGENVDWTPEDQRRFEAVCREVLPAALPRSGASVGGVREKLRSFGLEPHHRAAIEAAAVELGLGQASTDLSALSGRPRRPVRFCRSIGREEVEEHGPLAAVQALLAARPAARLKLDCPPAGWTPETWEALAATGRVVVLDFKREGTGAQVELGHRHLPEAWLEDPPVAAVKDRARGNPGPAWLARVALDGYVGAAADLDRPAFPPAAVNVKAPRVGGPLEALAVLERCRRSGWHAYVGGMFEVGAGRRQARALASLFAPDAWNDLAPLSLGTSAGAPGSP